ncbi:MAG: bifunctional phosphopantothenoylcysteine decarboxylase/phosphopantothenate synthase [Candidatus Methanofastidiosum methylothiophilum]|uniref:Coenzyme A biosynthesis bifunctional protein CoaBC n=1 Tax=Candidatus Methanofastidiosum methylothiophilum TaxID=1705564 RepID=A0A150IU09_9EURY|nr:MAG: bifunctional phosphopantothenoylcysteine decarboxylase/phosphopantothenate synthase [Candidatus Methanofastidiosum methylthiophilus]KYC48440.1 MAG: bifunctional phosphopantothenoylcysteine decarboxylase/phosphopantothenate synthase [Candidatus Methanofastidiosum methylthiophilus]KYC51048.1 MAG: bifunctional phosphopantothenoylcysteine decarboxylase/phosphopantothenate synthase [Candidatus Methanofastidiosum methylthiophilus]
MTMHRKSIKGTKSKKLEDKGIVLGITGSIAAVESVKLSRELMRHGAEVYAVMSEDAKKIIHPYALEFATGNPVVDEITGKIEHVSYAGDHDKKCELILIAPCTANTISKIASGIDDTPVTTVASTGFGKIPIIIVPAMHSSMYKNPIILENIEKLKKHGVEFLTPKFEENKAKLPEIDDIVLAVIKKLYPKDFQGKKVLVTAGPTIEKIDDVRFITNKSSGLMGIKIAEELDMRGAEVNLILGPTYLESFVKTINVESYEDMFNAVMSNKDVDIAIFAAATSDFHVDNCSTGKISSNQPFNLALIPNKKIVEEFSKVSKSFIIGFKAEYSVSDDQLIRKAYDRLQSSNMDLIIANDVGKESRGFESKTNEVYIIDKTKKVIHLPLEDKEKLSEKIVNIIKKYLN